MFGFVACEREKESLYYLLDRKISSLCAFSVSIVLVKLNRGSNSQNPKCLWPLYSLGLDIFSVVWS